MEMPPEIGIIAFLLTTVFDKVVLRHYVLPWTSTPTGTLILIGLCLCLSTPRPKYSAILGLIAGVILLIKPIDGIALIPAGLYYLIQSCRFNKDLRSWMQCGRGLAWGALILAGFV